MKRINNITLSLNSDEKQLIKKAARKLGVSPDSIKDYTIIKKAIDARNKNNVFFVYTIDVSTTPRPIIVGAGPAGLFAALTLCEAGLKPIIIERGKPVEQRKTDIDLFWKTGKLNPQSNVQFGEGGAGTFSDGKLTTGIKDKRIQKVMEELVQLGAPGEIKYLAKPHIGTDNLIAILQNMRKKIESMGGEYRFNTTLKDIAIKDGCIKSATLESINGKQSPTVEEIPCNHLILAIGHSARDTFLMLEKNGIQMEVKPFSVGVRIEHKQSLINKAQYGEFYNHPKLGAADYKLNVKGADRGVYTFCMCPGGQVVNASSEEKRLAINGMSHYARDLQNANSAILVNVDSSDFPENIYGDSVLKGMYFQREIEEKAFKLGSNGEDACNYFAPVQLVSDFLKGRGSTKIGDVEPSYLPGYKLTDLHECLPDFVASSLKEGIVAMGKKIKGFDTCPHAVLTAVESRSSSPVRIVRNSLYQSSVYGLIPCGEGAGYAGGITSACVDGIKCAEVLLQQLPMG